MKKQEKKAISLIVLVVTIIVMIILAGSVIVTLSNSGIIGKANDAVEKTNLKQIQEMANVLWLDAYAGGAREKDALEKAVKEGFTGIDTSNYNINVTVSGVTVTLRDGVTPEEPELPQLNEYGFYYDRAYVIEAGDERAAYVFREDGSAELYINLVTGCPDMFCLGAFEVAFGKGKVNINGTTATLSADGTKLVIDGIEAVLSTEEVHGIYKGATYAGVLEYTSGSDNIKMEATVVIGTDNYSNTTVIQTVNGVASEPVRERFYTELTARDHVIYKDGGLYVGVSLNGQKITSLVDNDMVLTITEVPENYVEDNSPQLNRYGFYYDQMYATDWFDEDGTDMKKGFVFHRDGSAELYMAMEDFAGGDLFCVNLIESGVAYGENQITYTLDGTTKTLTVQNDGSLSDGTKTLGYAPMKLHGIYRDYEYIGKMTAGTQEIDIAFTVDINNYVIGTQAGVEIINMPLSSIKGREHILAAEFGTLSLSSDGMKVLAVIGTNRILMTRADSPSDNTTTSNVIPTGGTYYTGVTSTATGDYTGATSTYTAGDVFPTPTTGDVYVYGDYEYRYNMANNANIWMTLADFAATDNGYTLDEGWNVRVLDTEKETYSAPLDSINEQNITNLVYTYAFCRSLTTMPNVPSNVTTLIGTYVNATSMTADTIVIPNGVTTIGFMTFGSCFNIKGVQLPESLTYIGMIAFMGAINMTGELTIPKNVSYIGDGAFYATKITAYNVAADNTYYNSADGVLYTEDMKTLLWYPCGKTDKEFTIPSTVTTISNSSFAGSNLETITIQTGVTSIGVEAFEGCDSLTSISIPKSVTSIGSGAFKACSSLATINYAGTETEWGNVQKEEANIASTVTIEYNK